MFEPRGELLLEALSEQIDESMLRDIASADYGSQIAENYGILRRIRDENLVPPSNWAPKEVLELIRWSQPDDPEWRPGHHGQSGHWMRAFCCAALLRMAGENDMDRHTNFNETVAGLVESLDILKANLWKETGSLLTWFVEKSAYAGYCEEDAFLGVALLFCALRANRNSDDPHIIALCEWICEREEAEAQGKRGAWLHRVSFHDQRRKTWKSLAQIMAGLDLRSHSRDAQQWIGMIVIALADG